jgi:hypothetical protein
MSALEAVPTELIDLIVDAVSIADLHSLALTCKRLHKSSTPALYNTVVINVLRDGTANVESSYRVQRNDVKNLCRTVLERPDLAKHIKTFQMRYRQFKYHHEEISEHEKNLFLEAIDSLPLLVDGKVAWKEAITSGRHGNGCNFDAVVSLLIAQCVSLERLSISIYYIRGYTWLSRIMKRPTAADVFPQLHTVRVVIFSDEHERVAQSTIEHFQWLPKVRQIILLHVSIDKYCKNPDSDLRPIYPLVATKPGASSLPALVVSKVSASTKLELPQYLALMPKLRTFVLRLMCPAPYHLPFDLGIMQKGLEHLRSTLSHLVFRIDIYSSIQGKASEVTDVCTGSLSFLRNFTALTTLETSLPLLFGDPKTANKQGHVLAEVLPPNLQELIIADDLWHVIMFVWTTTVWTMDVFKQFFSGERLSESSRYIDMDEEVVWNKAGRGAWKDATPNLREFVFDIRKNVQLSDYWDEGRVREELRLTCEKQGIKCRVLHE